MRILFVTSTLPCGPGEPFAIPEIAALKARGHDILIIPTAPRGPVVHDDVRPLLHDARIVPVLSPSMFPAALAMLAEHPGRVANAVAKLGKSRNVHILLKNTAVIVKALWVARWAQAWKADHIHAYWASTPATLAMIAAEIAGISWSLTSYRWDIAENNLLTLKARAASFIRVADSRGAQEMEECAGVPGFKAQVIYSGVQIPGRVDLQRDSERAGTSTLLVPANLVEKKGHVYLLEAMARLKAHGLYVQAEFAGDGPLREVLAQFARDHGIEDQVTFLGALSHHDLLAMMASGRWSVCVLPSIVTDSGEMEGIPISLIEAMASGIPVISTTTGGIPELLAEGAGLLVPPRDPVALAHALQRIMTEPGLAAQLVSAASRRVQADFAIESVATKLEQCIEHSLVKA